MIKFTLYLQKPNYVFPLMYYWNSLIIAVTSLRTFYEFYVNLKISKTDTI